MAAGIEFVTHDIFYNMLNYDEKYKGLTKFYPHFEPITIKDNVCIGGFVKIMPGVTINSKCYCCRRKRCDQRCTGRRCGWR